MWSDFLNVEEAANSLVSKRCRIRHNFCGRRFEKGMYYSIASVGLLFKNMFLYRRLVRTPERSRGKRL